MTRVSRYVCVCLLWTGALCLGALVGAACQPIAPVAPTREEARHDLDAMVFERKGNLCFGVIRFTSYADFHGVSITNVPNSACDAAEQP